MENIKDLYIIPHYECNLNCPHCTISKIHEKYNEENFLNTLNKANAQNITLFGGEPLLYTEKLTKILQTNKINSISTNLLLLSDYNLDLLKKYNLNIATSWNYTRFTKNQENIWISNLKKLEIKKLNCIILITLTEDLITSSFENFMKFLHKLNKIKSISGILFEQLVDNTKDYIFYEKADEWLCKIFKNWNFSFENLILNKLTNWNCDCTKTYTLTPSGHIKKGCPQYTTQYVCNKCLTCKMASICRPCVLQKECTFPKKLYGLLNNG